MRRNRGTLSWPTGTAPTGTAIVAGPVMSAYGLQNGFDEARFEIAV
jgi:hypothetical protein